MNPANLNRPSLRKNALFIFAASMVAACVTVNVNFPESAVQKATDNYVRELYRAKEKGRGTTPAATDAAKPGAQSRLESLALIPDAQAADDIKVDSAKALGIRQKLSARIDEVLAQKRAGVLGESSDGQLTLQAPDKLKPLLKAKVQKLVADENADRADLYAEVLKANGFAAARTKDIQKSFSRSFQAESPSGTWVQDAGGGWSQKP
jgi:uncharacterized protein YdbL (DUF1318 family)